ncbi:MAG TPA: response regulator transcription factor [Candidatus Krumholzibacterium sp.]|nr:response regulator transcription factor [Candidatus Krumholzibacterium sp.]
MTRILLADDHRLMTEGLKALLDRSPGFEVAGIALDGIEAVEMAAEERPDIVILDVSMPRLNGVEAARQILRDLPETRIIMLSMHADRRFVQESLKVGARGYILKESASNEVLQAIKAVSRGEFFLSPPLRDRVINEFIELIRDGDVEEASPLSPREREVLQLVAEGRSTKEIAGTLNVSVKTIESHRRQIMEKLDLHSVAELTKYAVRTGLTTLE